MLIRTEEEYGRLLGRLGSAGPLIVYDTETTGLDAFRGDRIVGVSVLIPDMAGKTDGDSYYVPFRHEVGRNLPEGRLVELLRVLASPDRVLVGFNLKFDVHFTEAEGVPVQAGLMDVMLAAHLCNENELSFSLKRLSDKYLGPESSAEERELLTALKMRGLDDKGGMAKLPPEVVAPYAEQDVVLTWRLARHYTAELDRQGLSVLWAGENAYLEAIVAMEKRGVLIDPEGCKRHLDEARARRDKLHADMRAIVGYDFNPDSVPQMRKILGQRETDRKAMAVSRHPVARMLTEARSWGKAASTFYEAFLNLMDSGNRIHPNLNMIGTISGRLSCRGGINLQGLPKGKSVYKVRDLIVAPPGHVLMSWDWNQTELRVLAHYTKDPFLVDAFRGGKDIHGETAAGLSIARDPAKRINFGIVFGLGATGLAGELGIPRPEAQRILDRYNKLIPGVRRLYTVAQRMAERRRFIPMWTGRLRHYRDEDTYHKALSNLIQGGVAEMMRVALTRLHGELKGSDAHQILQVHDEVLFEVPEGEAARWAGVIKAAMEDFNFNVPIVAGGKVGRSWGDGAMVPIAT